MNSFHPLAGKRFEKGHKEAIVVTAQKSACFHPLAGKRFEKDSFCIAKWHKLDFKVSIPLRGKGLRKPKGAEKLYAAIRAVSIPLRGKGLRKRFFPIDWLRFPNLVSIPLRGKGLRKKRPTHLSVQRGLWLVSIPLRGKGLRKRNSYGSSKQWKTTVSIPLRGKGLRKKRAKTWAAATTCFHPLAGKRFEKASRT